MENLAKLIANVRAQVLKMCFVSLETRKRRILIFTCSWLASMRSNNVSQQVAILKLLASLSNDYSQIRSKFSQTSTNAFRVFKKD